MREKKNRLRWLGATVLMLFGCWTTQHQMRPPQHPEEYLLPPATEPRFRTAPGTQELNPYPATKKEPTVPTAAPKMPSQRMGGNPGTGGM